jgi:hypothetical protein
MGNIKWLFVFLLVSITNNGLAQSFNDVPISGSLTTVIERFRAKGYRLDKIYDGKGAVMLGTHLQRPIEIIITATPKTKQVYKYSIFLSKLDNWNSLYSDYERTTNSLLDKYGDYTHETSDFLYPYELGDGYEMIAVQSDKCDYKRAWIGTLKNNVMVSISEFKQVKITYENPVNAELNEEETRSINARIF